MFWVIQIWQNPMISWSYTEGKHCWGGSNYLIMNNLVTFRLVEPAENSTRTYIPGDNSCLISSREKFAQLSFRTTCPVML